MTAKLLSRQQEDVARLQVMARVFQRADRVLANSDLYCRVVKMAMSAPAWSDGTTITFNANVIGDVTDAHDLVILTGLNYHELSHIFYTPRQDHWLSQKVQNDGNFFAMNILEDQRIETLFSVVYPSAIPYFVATFMGFCLNKPQQVPQVFPLSHGRRYLPLQVRKMLRKQYERQQDVKAMARIIDTYRLLVLPGMRDDEDKAYKLITEFADLIRNLSQQPSEPYGHADSNRPNVQEGKPLDKETQAEDVQSVQSKDGKGQEAQDDGKDEADGDGGSGKQGSEEESSGKEPGGKSGDEKSEDGADGQGSGKGKADQEDEGEEGSQGDGGEDQGPEASVDDDNPGVGKGHGRGAGTKSGASVDDLLKAMQQALDEAESDQEVVADVKSKQSTIVDGDGEHLTDLRGNFGREMAVDPTLQNITKKFAGELQRLRADLDPGWDRYHSSGKLNLQRAIRGDGIESLFDKWEEGKNDAADIECYMSVDMSSSMSANQMMLLSKALWCIKRGVESVNGTVTVSGYNDESYLLYAAKDKALGHTMKRFSSTGSTYPLDSINDAVKLFHASRRKHKVFICLTDGGWSETRRSHEMIIRMNGAGVTTALVYLGVDLNDTNEEYMRRIMANWHECRMHTVVQEATDLIPFAKELVKSVMKMDVR